MRATKSYPTLTWGLPLYLFGRYVTRKVVIPLDYSNNAISSETKVHLGPWVRFMMDHITPLERIRNELLRQLANVDESLILARAKHNENAPISSLPDEILAMIFEEGRIYPFSGRNSGAIADDIGVYIVSPAFELVVSQVSRRWRNAAINCPSLWTNIIITSWHPSQCLLMYLERSKSSPIDLRLFFHREFDLSDDIHDALDAKHILSSIIPHIHRCRHIDIVNREAYIYATLSRFRDSSAPLLESMSIIRTYIDHEDDNNFDDDDDDDDDNDDDLHLVASYPRPKTIFSGGAPRLSHLRLDSTGLSCCWPPLDALTTLHIDASATLVVEWKHEEFHELINASPSLTTLIIHLEFVELEHSKPIEIPSLRTLDVTSIDIPDMLSASSFPSLESFTIRSIRDDQLGDVQAILPLPKLRLLTLNDINFHNDDTYTKLFDCFPTITHLTIVGTSTMNILRILNSPASAESWPRLHTIRILEWKGAEIQVQQLVAGVVEGRGICDWSLD